MRLGGQVREHLRGHRGQVRGQVRGQGRGKSKRPRSGVGRFTSGNAPVLRTVAFGAGPRDVVESETTVSSRAQGFFGMGTHRRI